MLWIDLVFRAATLISAIVATLRAGSRIVYLRDHEGIGIMDGPTIQNTNETYPLFELSEAFRHCVRLSFSPEYYENVQWRQPVETVVEPYPLSPRPYIQPEETEDFDEEISVSNSTELLQNVIESSVGESQTRITRWRNHYRSMLGRVRSIPSSVSGTFEYLAMAPQVFSYFTNQMWRRRLGRTDESNLELDDEGKT